MSVCSHRKSPIFSYMQEAPWKTQLIILGASGKSGWVPNTTPVSLKKKKTGDSHDEMTAEQFEERLCSQAVS